ncbi:MAG: type IV pilin protein [Rudaea sp.]
MSSSIVDRCGTSSRARSQAGITLIELVIALAVVAILAMIALPSYGGAMNKARRSEGKILLQAAMAAEERYFTTFNRYTSETGSSGLGVTATSEPGAYYRLATPAVSGDGQTVRVVAEPQGTQAADPCGSLGLDSVGRRTAAQPDGCW